MTPISRQKLYSPNLKNSLLKNLAREFATFLVQIISFHSSRREKKLSLARMITLICQILPFKLVTRLLVGNLHAIDDENFWKNYSISDLFKVATNFAEPFKTEQVTNLDIVLGKGEIRKALSAYRRLRAEKLPIKHLLFLPSCTGSATSERNLRIFRKMGFNPSETFVMFDQADPFLSYEEIQETIASFAGYYVSQTADYLYSPSAISEDSCIWALVSSSDIATITVAGSQLGASFVKRFRTDIQNAGLKAQMILAEHQQWHPNLGLPPSYLHLFDSVETIQDPDGRVPFSRGQNPVFDSSALIERSDFPFSISIGTDNHEVISKWVIDAIEKLPSTAKILDAGAGEKRYQRYCKHLQYTSQDFNQYDGKGDGKGLQTENWGRQGLDIVSDITEIPAPDESFDAVLCTEVLEHVPDAIKALKELSRLLKKNGTMILTAPFASLTHFAPYHYSSGLIGIFTNITFPVWD